jgi:hypothetical protein
VELALRVRAGERRGCGWDEVYSSGSHGGAYCSAGFNPADDAHADGSGGESSRGAYAA